MNNTRKTVNLALSEAIKAQLPGFGFFTGDEEKPVFTPPFVAVDWLQGAYQSRRRPEGRIRLVQLEVQVGNRQTSILEDAQEKLLAIFGILKGSDPIGVLPKLDLSAGRPGVPTGTELIITTQAGSGWNGLDAQDQTTRRAIITLQIDYVP